MTPDLWQRVCRAFDRAANFDTARRTEYLRDLEQRDSVVAQAVADLFEQEQAPRLLERVPPRVWQLVDDQDTSGATAAEWPPQIGSYAVHAELARGGMGIVLRVTDHKFDRTLAVKVLAQRFRQNAALVQRFREEARLMGRLQHPNIPPVHDWGELADGRPYLAMKLIKGRTLAQILRERRGDQAEGNGAPSESAATEGQRLLHIFEQACHALAYAHARGVIHRDIKSANIMVGAYGEIQVMDWGLAKVLRRDDGPDPNDTEVSRPDLQSQALLPPQDMEETVAGAVLGTPAYMAPEQARGDIGSLDERCDVFGLGATLCEILTGRPPFAATDRDSCMALAKRGDVRQALSLLEQCGADPDLIALAKNCLAPERDDRPRHAGVVAAAVVQYRSTLQDRLRQAEIEQAATRVRIEEERKRRRVRRLLTAVVCGFVALATAAGIWDYLDRLRIDEANRLEVARKEVHAALAEERAAADRLRAQLGDPQRVHELISDIDDWQQRLERRHGLLEKAKVSLQAAGVKLITSDLADAMRTQRDQLEADRGAFALARELDAIRQESFKFLDDEWNPTAAAPKYARFFAERLQLDLTQQAPPQLADSLRASPLHRVLVAALDHWADVSQHPSATEQDNPQDKTKQLARLLEIARLADADPWRDAFRRPEVWQDRAQLEKLAAELLAPREPGAPFKVAEQSPHVLLALASQLDRTGANGSSVRGAALVAFPHDFWLNLTMANTVVFFAEKAGYYQAALARRPTSSVAWNNRAAVLYKQHKLAEAVAACRRASALDPSDWSPHRLIGIIRFYQGRHAEASAAAEKALKLIDPSHPFQVQVFQQWRDYHRCVEMRAQEKKQPALEADQVASLSGALTGSDPTEHFPYIKDSHRKVHRVALRAKKHYLIDLVAQGRTIGEQLDTILRIESDEGTPLLMNDDVGPGTRNSRLLFSPEHDGVYRLVVNSYIDVQAAFKVKTGDYVLRVRDVAADKPKVMHGELKRSRRTRDGKYFEVHRVTLNADVPYVLELHSPRFDTYLQLWSGDEQKVLARNDDVAPANTRISRIDFTPRTTGEYAVEVTTFANAETGPYTLTVQSFQTGHATERPR